MLRHFYGPKECNPWKKVIGQNLLLQYNVESFPIDYN